jgi:hypothetical protein
MQEARWLGIAAIEAFFGWTEHVLIHIGILLGNIGTGQDLARLAESEWSEKVKAAIDLSSEKETKAVYEDLLEVRPRSGIIWRMARLESTEKPSSSTRQRALYQ